MISPEERTEVEQEPPVVQVPDADSPATVPAGGGSEAEESERGPRERPARDRDSSLSELFWGED